MLIIKSVFNCPLLNHTAMVKNLKNPKRLF